MPRGKKHRYCRRFGRQKGFKPIGIKGSETVKIEMELDQFEAMRLCDYEQMNQIEAGELMGVSRGTIQRLLIEARSKMVEAVLDDKMLIITEKKHYFKGVTMGKYDARVAFPTNNKTDVEQHFGHCRYFAVCNILDKKVESIEYLEAPPHAPGVLPKFLGAQNITAIITGGMGQMAINMFKQQNIDVVLGAVGSIENNVETYINGELYSKGSPCDHHHGDHNCHD